MEGVTSGEVTFTCKVTKNGQTFTGEFKGEFDANIQAPNPKPIGPRPVPAPKPGVKDIKNVRAVNNIKAVESVEKK